MAETGDLERLIEKLKAKQLPREEGELGVKEA